MKIREKLEQGVLIFDGGMGTMLQNKGLLSGEIPEIYNLTHPRIVEEIHREYVLAGADVITANTFQANPIKIPQEYDYRHLIHQGVSIAKASGAPYVALDIGPLGQMFKPLGTFSFEDAYNIFKAQVVAGQEAGADCIIIETFSDLLEAKIAILAAKENSSLPVFCTMTFQEDGRTFMGCDPITAVTTLEGLGIDAIGANCSLGPKELSDVVEEILFYSSIPVIIQPNAGLPEIIDGKAQYLITPEEYSRFTLDMVKNGVKIVGGCCGTTPEFIKLLRAGLGSIVSEKAVLTRRSSVSSGVKTLVLGQDIAVIGERINSEFSPKLMEEIQKNNLDYIIDQAGDQADEGCNIISINVGVAGADEAGLLEKLVGEIQIITRLPLQISSDDPKAIEAAVRVYNGKSLIKLANSDTGTIKGIFPIAKKYGTMILVPEYDGKEMTVNCEQRVQAAGRIVEAAFEYGIPKENLIIGCHVIPDSDRSIQKSEIIKVIKGIKTKFNVLTAIETKSVKSEQLTEIILDSEFLKEALVAGAAAVLLNPSAEYIDIIKSIVG